MSELNNSQLILLAILVSFVTSIATGIITSSLLDEAPISVTQTINRVVENTVERVVPQSVKETIREERVVVKEADYVTSIVEKVWPSIVIVNNRLLVESADGRGYIEQKDTLPLFVIGPDKKGLMLVSDTLGHATTTYTLTVGSSTVRFYRDPLVAKSKLATLAVNQEDLNALKIAFSGIPLSAKAPRIGQQIIVTDGSGVTLGIVSQIKTVDATTEIGAIEVGNTTLAGKRSLILSLEGELLGILGASGEVITAGEIKDSVAPPAKKSSS